MRLDWLQVLTLIMGEDFGNNHAAITLLSLESGLQEYSVSVQTVKEAFLKCT